MGCSPPPTAWYLEPTAIWELKNPSRWSWQRRARLAKLLKQLSFGMHVGGLEAHVFTVTSRLRAPKHLGRKPVISWLINDIHVKPDSETWQLVPEHDVIHSAWLINDAKLVGHGNIMQSPQTVCCMLVFLGVRQVVGTCVFFKLVHLLIQVASQLASECNYHLQHTSKAIS